MLRSTILAAVLASPVVASPHLAHARYAPPPGAPPAVVVRDDCPEYDPYCREPAEPSEVVEPRSSIRIFTGPALRVAGDTSPGLFAAIDVGARAAGARLSGTWIGAGGDEGYSLYTGELWIDFGEGRRLHPILAAGAGVARVEHENAERELEGSTIGVGLLRGSLQYRLPVESVDARAGLDLGGAVRAFGEGNGEPGAWFTAAAMVGVGF